MIQIRRKKEEQRQSIRREFLHNHFRELRKTCFNFGANNQKNSHSQLAQLVQLLNQSLQQNCLAIKLRQPGFMSAFEQLIDQAIIANCLISKKFLLTIISNVFKDQLEVDQKIALYRLSASLFQSLKLSHYDRDNHTERQTFKNTIKTVQVQTLVYYMFSANQISPCLDQQNQYQIQQLIYPAFVNVFLYAANHPESIQDLPEFQNDFKNFLKNIFDSKQSFYEPGNRIKAQRLLPFYAEIIKVHLWLLQHNQHFKNLFSQLQFTLLRSYNIVIDVLEDLPDIFKGDQIFSIIEFTFQSTLKQTNYPLFNQVYSILRRFLEKKVQLQLVEKLLGIKDQAQGLIAFEWAIKLVMDNSEIKYRGMQIIERVMECYHEDHEFKELVEKYIIRLVEMCAQVLNNFVKEKMGEQKYREFILKALAILRLLVEKEHIEGRNQNQNMVKSFENLGGVRALTNILTQYQDADVGDDTSISFAIDYIEEIFQIIELDFEF